jgi:hypothetical protein
VVPALRRPQYCARNVCGVTRSTSGGGGEGEHGVRPRKKINFSGHSHGIVQILKKILMSVIVLYA